MQQHIKIGSLIILLTFSLLTLSSTVEANNSSNAGLAQDSETMQHKLQQNQWQLVSYSTLKGMQAVLPDHKATILFSGRKVSGSTGCNQYFSSYQLQGSSGLLFSQSGSTMMACQPDIAEQEQQYLKNMTEIRFYQIDNEQLQLIDAEQQVRMIYKSIPALQLENNDWLVTGINNGHGGVVSSVHTSQAYLQFIKGKLQGNSGCNTLLANYHIEDNALNIGTVSSTRKMCSVESLMIQEQQIVQALTQVTHYEIRTNQLRLLNADGSLLISLKSKM